MMNPRTSLLFILTAALGACTGVLGGDEPGGAGGGGGASGNVAATAMPLRRLSKAEYTNTVHDLLTLTKVADPVVLSAAVDVVLSRLPDDTLVSAGRERRGGFHRLDQDVQQTHADVAYAVAMEVGKQLTGTPARLEATFGHCIGEGDKDACVTRFLRNYGEHVLRRPVSDADVAFYKTPLGGAAPTPEALADVVALLFAAPDVFYVVERSTTGSGPSRPLGPYELAARLAYHFTETLPDEQLFALARSGDLAKDDVYAQQVDRLAAGPHARAILDELFGEWLRLDELDRLDQQVGDPVFDAFAGANAPTAALRVNMFNDVLDAAAAVTARGGTIKDLLENRQSFARTEDLAKIYGVPVWDGKSEPPTFTDPTRAGLITRAAFLATGTANTRPIMKGVRLRMGLLCQNVPPPPANAANAHADLSPTQTTRQVIEQLTQSEGSSCASCHATIINPLGFATENFDSLGRSRTAQSLFDRFGNMVAAREVNTITIPRVLPEDKRLSTGAVDVTRYMVESKAVDACFARNVFRFAFTRGETNADNAVIDALATTVAQKPIAEVLKSIALRPEFKSHTVKEGS